MVLNISEISERALSKDLAAVLGYGEQYFRSKLGRMKSGLDFLPNLVSFDRWYFKLEELIANKLQPSSLGVDHQEFLDQSIHQQEALTYLEEIYSKYDKIFGLSKNEYALDLRRSLVQMVDYFGKEEITELKDIIGYNEPYNYYGIKHPDDGPYGLSALDHLLKNPLKSVIEKLGKPITDQDLKNDEEKGIIEIGDYLSIDYSRGTLEFDYSDSLSITDKSEIETFLETVEDTVNDILSYNGVAELIESFDDSPKKYLTLQLLKKMNNFVPNLGSLSLFKISSALLQNKDQHYLYHNLWNPSTEISFFVDTVKFEILSLNKDDFCDKLGRVLTNSEFGYMKGELLNEIDKFILTFRLDPTNPMHPTHLGSLLYYPNLNYRDRVLAHNLIENVKMAVSLHKGDKIYHRLNIKDVINIGTRFDIPSKMFPSAKNLLTQDLKLVYNSIYWLFVNEFGSRDPGMEKYKKLSTERYNKYYYYSEALQSIIDVARAKNIDFNSPSIRQISLLEAIKKKGTPRELVMDHYDIEYWGKRNVIPYHRFYHLTKYLGFDPLLFMGLDPANLDTSMKYSRGHHFRGFVFKKMSSFVQDQILTNVQFHPSYESLFTEFGPRQAEAIIEGLLAAMEDLIYTTDSNGNFKDVDEFDVKEALKRYLGSLWDKGWKFWVTKGRGINTKTISEFRNRDLVEFNKRRRFIIANDGRIIPDGFQNFLEIKFEDYYRAHFMDVVPLLPALFLGTRRDFAFMNFVYVGRHKFDLSNL